MKPVLLIGMKKYLRLLGVLAYLFFASDVAYAQQPLHIPDTTIQDKDFFIRFTQYPDTVLRSNLTLIDTGMKIVSSHMLDSLFDTVSLGVHPADLWKPDSGGLNMAYTFVNITASVDSTDTLLHYNPTDTLFTAWYDLKVYKPGDTVGVSSPAYTWDSIEVLIQGNTPVVRFSADMTTFVKSWISLGLMNNPASLFTFTLALSAGTSVNVASGFPTDFVSVTVSTGSGVGTGVKPGSPLISTDSVCVCSGPNSRCTSLSGRPTVSGNRVNFQWYNCFHKNRFQLQILRLFNSDTTKTTATAITTTPVDWSQALTVEAPAMVIYSGGAVGYGGSYGNTTLTLAEGTGFYVWRARFVGDYPNDLADDRNWGPWSCVGPFIDGAQVVIANKPGSTVSPWLFFFDQVTSNAYGDTLNWIYNRKFVGEYNANTELEKATFANYLLMPIQEQNLHDMNRTWGVSQTIPDYSGRPSLKTLEAPVSGKLSYSYQYNYIRNIGDSLYTAADYDQEGNYLTPRIIDTASTSKLGNYYSDGNSDLTVPSAHGYPYSRTLYYNDGLNRERDIASPGYVHAMGKGHTIKKYYCKPTQTELIRIFGDEAPDASFVKKTYTIDPNGVFNVSYTDASDKVLATCLSAPNSTLLDTIPANIFTAYDTVKKRQEASSGAAPGTRFVSTATYSFGIPTQIKFLYEILPKIYGDQCLGLCTTCDYKVWLTAKKREDTSLSSAVVFYDSLFLSPSFDTTSYGCTTSWQQMNPTPASGNNKYYINSSYTLDPGTYDICLTLQLSNELSATHKTYIDTMVQLLHRSLDREFAGTADVINVNGSTVTGATGVSVSTIKSYLASSDILGLLAYLSADTAQPYFQLAFPCDTLLLPTAHCEAPNCSSPTFAEYMVSMLNQYDAEHTAYFSLGGAGIEATTDPVHNWFDIAGNVAFDSVIIHMVDSGYSCDTLWQAWQSTVQSFISKQIGYFNKTGYPFLDSPKVDWWADFMDRVGYKKPLDIVPASELSTAHSSFQQFPFIHFPYDWGTTTKAEDLFCILMGGHCTVGPPPDWYSTINNYPYVDPGTTPFHLFNFINMVKSPGTAAYAGIATSSGAMKPAILTHVTQAYGEMEVECYKACERRLNGLLNTMNASCNDNQMAIDGMPSAAWTGRVITTVPLPSAYCIAYDLIATCEAGCILVPDTSGIVDSNQIKAYKQSLLYNMELQMGSDTDHTGNTLPPLVCDTGFTSLTPDCSHRPGAQASLDWINRVLTAKRTELYNTGYSAAYNFAPYSTTYTPSSMTAVIAPPGSCNTSSAAVDIYAYDLKEWFSYGRSKWDSILGTSNIPPSGYNIYTNVPDSVFGGSENILINTYVVMTAPLNADDSLILKTDAPSFAGGGPPILLSTISMGSPGPSKSIRYAIQGPLDPGDTVTFSYYIKTVPPSSTPPLTTITFNSRVIHYLSGAPNDSLILPACSTDVVTCIPVYLNRIDAGGVYRVANVCTLATSPPYGVCNGALIDTFKVCYRWVLGVDTITPDTTTPRTCGQVMCANFTNNIDQQIDYYHHLREGKLRDMYKSKCQGVDSVQDVFVNYFDINQYVYTLYYYDRAGNLIRTVAPAGVRDTGTTRMATPAHYMVTSYEHNSLQQVLNQTTPDAGKTTFVYDDKGRLVQSQNAKQLALSTHSYTLYDALSRVIETGDSASSSRDNVTKTVYTTPYPLTGVVHTTGALNTTTDTQSFILNRVSYTITDRNGNFADSNDQAITLYSYDPHGNVNWQDKWTGGMGAGYAIRYIYDVATNKLTYVSFDCNSISNPAESYYHEYSYNNNNTLASAYAIPSIYVGKAGGVAAAYSYDKLDKLITTVTSFSQENYTYTIEGWLKAINFGNGKNNPYTEVLTYYNGDFTRPSSPFVSAPGILANDNLYNGNIVSKIESIYPTGASGKYFEQQTGYTYRYDQLNRVTKSVFKTYASGSWTNNNAYNEQFSYDNNGNFINIARHTYDAVLGNVRMDSLDYSYYTGTSWGITVPINRMKNEADHFGTHYGHPDVPSTYDYQYDAIGNVTTDGSTNDVISWTPYGKIDTIGIYDSATGTTLQKSIYYLYDANGNRVKSTTYFYPGKTNGGSVFYIHDASNNVMAMFDQQANGNWNAAERYAYGNKRFATIRNGNVIFGKRSLVAGYLPTFSGSALGILPAVVSHYATATSLIGSYTRSSGPIAGPVTGISTTIPAGYSYYEFHDHLGNVRAVTNNAITPSSWINPIPNMVSYYNYYAFGSLQPGRYYEGGGTYRFGFNGQEKDDDWLGDGTFNHFAAREQDSRLGRFLSSDPLDKKYPGISPYAFAENDVIRAKDLEGLEKFIVGENVNNNQRTRFVALNEDVNRWNDARFGYTGPNGLVLSNTPQIPQDEKSAAEIEAQNPNGVFGQGKVIGLGTPMIQSPHTDEVASGIQHRQAPRSQPRRPLPPNLQHQVLQNPSAGTVWSGELSKEQMTMVRSLAREYSGTNATVINVTFNVYKSIEPNVVSTGGAENFDPRSGRRVDIPGPNSKLREVNNSKTASQNLNNQARKFGEALQNATGKTVNVNVSTGANNSNINVDAR